MATELPEQMVALFTASVGVAFTKTVETIVLDAIQPAVLVPVTEYCVVVEGLTV